LRDEKLGEYESKQEWDSRGSLLIPIMWGR